MKAPIQPWRNGIQLAAVVEAFGVIWLLG